MHQDDWHAEACNREVLPRPRRKVPYVAPHGGRMEPPAAMSSHGGDLVRLKAVSLQALATRVMGGLFAAFALAHGEWLEAVVMTAIASPFTTTLIYRILKRGR